MIHLLLLADILRISLSDLPLHQKKKVLELPNFLHLELPIGRKRNFMIILNSTGCTEGQLISRSHLEVISIQ